MTIKQMIEHVNRLTGNGMYNENQLLPYFDECVDAINQELGFSLPTVTNVYDNDFTKTDKEIEESLDFVAYDLDNPYTRISDKYIRNYICYEVSYRILRDEDEDPEVYQERAYHADRWFRKLVGLYSTYTMEDTEAIIVNGDLDELEDVPLDDTALGFYNPYFDTDDGDI